MLTLTTGLPGAGKSLYTILMVEQKAKKENRAVYYHGIKELTLDWTEIDDPAQAYKLPAGAIIVIDECQSSYRPRSTGSAVPPHVAALETHRHDGHDYFFITQHPMLVDPNLRRLVGQHFHVVRKFGFPKATVHEWNKLKDAPEKSRNDSIRHDFIYPKSAYGTYKSAEIHTVKAKLPARVYFLYIGVPLLVAALGFFGYKALNKLGHPDSEKNEISEKLGNPLAITSTETTGSSNSMTWLEKQIPRIPDMPNSAPKYDEVQKPKVVPYPAACMAFKSRCQCYTQQGTKMQTEDTYCRQIVANGYFIDWQDNPEPRPSMTTNEPKEPQTVPKA